MTLVLAVLAWASPHPALAKGAPSSLEGQVLNVGSGKPNGTLHLRGKVRAAGALDLGSAKLQVISFLSERRGSLELVSAEESRLNLLFASGAKN